MTFGTLDFTAPFNVGVEAGTVDPTKYTIWVYQGGLGMPNREYYLDSSQRMADLRKAYQAHIAAARERNELVVVPLGLAGGGQFYWAFPGLVIVGVGVESADREARRKERAEMTAARMKVLSDPTRVGILMELVRPSHHAATVTELASQFGLSQPTVSVHLKILREAGLREAEFEALRASGVTR